MIVLLVIIVLTLVLLALNQIRTNLIMNRWIENQRDSAEILKRHLENHQRRQKDLDEIDYASAMAMLAHLRDLHGMDTSKLPQPEPPL